MFTNDSPSCNPAIAASWIHPTRPQSICSITRCFCTLVFPFPPHKAEFNQSTGSAGSFNSVCVFIHVFVTVKCAALALKKSFKSSVNCGPRINSPTWNHTRFQVHNIRNQRHGHKSSHIPAQHLRATIGVYFRLSIPSATSSSIPAAIRSQRTIPSRAP